MAFIDLKTWDPNARKVFFTGVFNKGLGQMITIADITSKVQVRLPKLPTNRYDLYSSMTYVQFAKDVDALNNTLLVDRERMDAEWIELVDSLAFKMMEETPQVRDYAINGLFYCRQLGLGHSTQAKQEVEEYWANKKARYSRVAFSTEAWDFEKDLEEFDMV